MIVGIYQSRLGLELGLYLPSRQPQMPQHPGVLWARAFRVVWRRINRTEAA